MRRVLMGIAVALVSVTAAIAEETKVEVSQPAPAEIGQKLSFSFTKIVVSDVDRAMRFYTAIGMKESRRDTTPEVQDIMMKFDGDTEPTLVLSKYADNRKVKIGTGYGNLGIVTPDIRGLYARLESAGFKQKTPPSEESGLGIIVGMTKDPDGHPIEIVQMLTK